MEWSLGLELARMADCPEVAEACVSLRLVSKGEVFRLSTRYDWAARGSETFTFAFDVVTGEACKRSFLLKALVPPLMTCPLDEALERYLSNSHALSTAGVGVPQIYAAYKGTILTDYIPYDLFDYLRAPTGDSASSHQALVRQAVDAFRMVIRIGFRPLGDLDFRTDGRAVYLVDLGSDLGAPSSEPKDSDDTLVRRWLSNRLHKSAVRFTDEEISVAFR